MCGQVLKYGNIYSSYLWKQTSGSSAKSNIQGEVCSPRFYLQQSRAGLGAALNYTDLTALPHWASVCVCVLVHTGVCCCQPSASEEISSKAHCHHVPCSSSFSNIPLSLIFLHSCIKLKRRCMLLITIVFLYVITCAFLLVLRWFTSSFLLLQWDARTAATWR